MQDEMKLFAEESAILPSRFYNASSGQTVFVLAFHFQFLLFFWRAISKHFSSVAGSNGIEFFSVLHSEKPDFSCTAFYSILNLLHCFKQIVPRAM